MVILRKAFLGNFKNDSIETLEVAEGEPLQLECDAPNGYPSPSIFWMIQTTQGAIKGIDNPRVTLDPTGNLWFSSVTRDDATKDSYYICSAASSAVNEYKLGNRIILKVTPRITKPFRAPTLQSVSPANMFALRGKAVEIFCIYDGAPLPKVAWSKDGKPLRFSDRIVLENYGKSLKIKKTDVNDEGNYCCRVSSDDGETQSSDFVLKVESPPSFTVEPQSRNVTMNETVEIKCEADGLPEPEIQWSFNGKSIRGDSQRREISKNKLIVMEVGESDEGNYACYATNQHGYVFKDIYINVQ